MCPSYVCVCPSYVCVCPSYVCVCPSYLCVCPSYVSSVGTELLFSRRVHAHALFSLSLSDPLRHVGAWLWYGCLREQSYFAVVNCYAANELVVCVRESACLREKESVSEYV